MGVGRASSPRWVPRLVAVALPLALVGAACTDDEEPSGGGDDEEIEGVELGTADSDDPEPKATDVETVQPLIEDLVDRYDAAVGSFSADPGRAGDPDAPDVVDYRALFEPGTDLVTTSLAGWEADVDAGRHVEPADPARPAIDTRLDGPLAIVSEEEVVFAVCQAQQYRVVGEDGSVAAEESGTEVRGDWTAVWSEGAWRLSRIELITAAGGCMTRSEG